MSTVTQYTASIGINWGFSNPFGLGTTIDSGNKSHGTAFANGTGVNQINQIYHESGAISAGGNVDIDLNGTLLNAFGDAVDLTAVKHFEIKNLNLVVGDIIHVGGGDDGIGGNAFSTWVKAVTDIVIIGEGGALSLTNPSAAGFAVVAATGDILRLNAPGANPVNYEFMVGGTQ